MDNLLFLLALAATAVEMTACFLCARNLIQLHKEDWDRSRRILTLGAAFSGFMALIVVLANIIGTIHELPFFILQPWIGLLYMSMNIVMALYPISVIKPEWLTPKNGFILFSPVLLLAILYLFFTDKWTLLYAPEHIWKNLSQPDVIARLVSLFLMFPYCLIPLLLPYKYYKSSAYHRWIVLYSLVLLLICVTHIALMLTNNGILLILMPIMASTFYTFSTEYELEERLRPGKRQTEVIQQVEETDLASVPMEPDLWARICQIMDQEEAWRDPDLSLSSLSKLCATNVTYLGRIIQQETGKGFKEMVNAKRVESVVNQIKENPDIDVQTAFFNAGFRSRTTAWRNFKDITGMSPADFRLSLKQ
jgi:methylphosphotriester-DNA--protein-cysteine methyltransferase